MARIRTIKPEFWTSEQVVECSATARLLFVGLWTFCDDNGIHPASERRAKMEVFPGDDFTPKQVRGFIDELIRHDLLNEYEVDGAMYWQVKGFRKHQKIEKPTYRFPLPDGEQPVAKPSEDSTRRRRPVDEKSASDRPRNGMESNGVESNGMAEREGVPPCPAQEIITQFNATFGLKCQLTAKRRKQLRARWRNAFWRDHWRAALERAGPSRFLNGDNDRGWKIGLEFFLKPDSVTKILEGEYDNRAAPQRPTSGRPTTNESLANLARAGGMRLSSDAPVPDEKAGHIQPGAIRLLGQGAE